MFDGTRKFERDRGDSSFTGLNLAPMIDVVFLLLIFFMVSTTFISRPGLKLKLPRSGGQVDVPSKRWVISVNDQGQLFLNKTQIDLSRLQQKLSGKKPRPVILRADRKIPHGIVVKVLDRVRSAGIQDVKISTRPSPES